MGGHKLCKPNYLKVFQSATDYRRTQADDDARNHSGEQKHRKVQENLTVLKQKGGHQELPHVVQHASGHADSGDAELAGLLQGNHSKKANGCTAQRIEGAEDTVEKKAGDENSNDVYRCGMFRGKSIQRYQRDDVGNSKFNARDTRIIWYNSFHVGKYQRQCGQQSDGGYVAGSGIGGAARRCSF